MYHEVLDNLVAKDCHYTSPPYPRGQVSETLFLLSLTYAPAKLDLLCSKFASLPPHTLGQVSGTPATTIAQLSSSQVELWLPYYHCDNI